MNKNVPCHNKTTIIHPDGRFVIINGQIRNVKIIIPNIYRPNGGNPHSFHTVFSHINNFSNSTIIVGGDFNTILNPTLDRSNLRSTEYGIHLRSLKNTWKN